MNLKKPPVTQEQSLLEDYVDFLLTDLSNVTPIEPKLKSKPIIQQAVESTVTDTTEASDNPQIKPLTKTVDHLIDEQIEQTSNVISAELENLDAPDDFNETDNNAQSLNQYLDEQLSIIEQESHSQTQNEQALSHSLTQSFEQKELIDAQSFQPFKISHQENDFSEQAEEEEAKLWDALITKEKEEAFIQSLKESYKTENKDQNLGVNKRIKQSAKQSEPLNAKQPKAQLENSPEEFSIDKKVINKSIEVTTNIYNDTSRKLNKIEQKPDKKPHKEKDERLVNVEKLLAKISLATQPKIKQEQQLEQEHNISQQAAEATFATREKQKIKDLLPEVFQTLIFQVGKMPLAVPLLKLGGIVKTSMQDITPLVGTPNWFLGLVPHERGNLMVVDTQQFIMPEQKLIEKEYEFLILLDNSNWALACHSIGEAKNLTVDDIRWSERTSQKPWFAGMVVDFMSALVEVDELINMLAETVVE